MASLSSQQKSANTRKARTRLWEEYGVSADVVRLHLLGVSKRQIATYLGLTVPTVATTVGNFTRPGKFRRMALACKF